MDIEMMILEFFQAYYPLFIVMMPAIAVAATLFIGLTLFCLMRPIIDDWIAWICSKIHRKRFDEDKEKLFDNIEDDKK